MTKTEALDFFGGSAAELARAIGLTRQGVESWGDTVPRCRRQSVRMAMRERAERLDKEARELRKAAAMMEIRP